MKQVRYTDDTPSREVEDEDEDSDWESEGEEEMQKLYEKCKREDVSIVSVRDRLNNLHSLVEVCQLALGNKEYRGQTYCQDQVVMVLCCYVAEDIKEIEEDLRYV
jgi:hypothetical protein